MRTSRLSRLRHSSQSLSVLDPVVRFCPDVSSLVDLDLRGPRAAFAGGVTPLLHFVKNRFQAVCDEGPAAMLPCKAARGESRREKAHRAWTDAGDKSGRQAAKRKWMRRESNPLPCAGG